MTGFFSVLAIALCAASPSAAGALAWIELEPGDGSVTAVAHVARMDERPLRAELSIERLNGSNSVRSRQSSEVAEGTRRSHVVARSQVSIDSDDTMRLVLTVTDDEGILTTSRIDIGAPE